MGPQEAKAFGEYGIVVLHAGDLTKSNFDAYALQITTAAVVSSVTYLDSFAEKSNGDWADLATLPVGFYFGRFSEITLSSGEGIIYLNAKTEV